MQTKLKPILLLVMLAASAVLLYAANDSSASHPAVGLFNVSDFSTNVISISPKLKHSGSALPIDSARQKLVQMDSIRKEKPE